MASLSRLAVIYSGVGHGTTVKLYLPRALQGAVFLEKPAKELPRGQGETILVVEDEAARSLLPPSPQRKRRVKGIHCVGADAELRTP